MDTCNHGLAGADSLPSASTTISPHCYINNLPDELISEILAAVVPSDLEGPTEALYKPKQIPAVSYDFAVLAQLVCKRWKEVAWHTPALWAVLDFKRMQAANLPLFLRRSGIYPLCIDLSEAHRLNDEEAPQLQEKANLALRAHVNRVSQLYITGRFCSLFLGAFKDLLTGVANLRKLCLHMGTLGDWTLIPTCAGLQSLSIIERFPTFVPPHTFFTVLRGCPHLRMLHLETQDFGEWSDENPPEKPQPFVLRQLEQLTLRNFYKWEMAAIFSIISTPNLKEFIVAEAAQRPGSQKGLGIFCPALGTLVIEGADMSRDIAKEISHVKHLALIRSPHSALEIDIGFQSLRSYWQSLPDPIPLETLRTNHLKLSSLISLLEDDRPAVIPKLHQVTVYYADAFCAKDSTEFEKRAGEWSRLSSLVETGVYGIPDEEIEARMKVTSWEEEREWLTELNKTYVMAGWRKD